MNTPISIVQVRSKAELKAFIRFPDDLYRDYSHWVPPLRVDERSELVKVKNIVLRRSEHIILLARRSGRTVGRIIVYIDPAFNQYYGTKTGFFGNFEAVDDSAVFKVLFSAAENWLIEQGMKRLRGPINPIAECWGFLFEGFSSPPVFMSPYNPKYYNTMLTDLGYKKAKDLLVYEANGPAGYEIPVRFRNFPELFSSRHPNISVRSIDLNHLKRDAEHIWRILNVAVADNWGFVPVAREEMEDVVQKLKPIIDPDAVYFVEDKGHPVGCCLGFPDLNKILKKTNGRLFPFGFLRVLFGIKKVRDYRLWGLAVLPEYAGKGLDVLLYERLYRTLKPKGVRLEANYILEDNLRIKNALEKLGLTYIKKYRVYEKTTLQQLNGN